MTNVEELHHHGIKGQRWGVIRTKKQLGYKTTPKIVASGKGYTFNSDGSFKVEKGVKTYRSENNRAEQLGNSATYISVSEKDARYWVGDRNQDLFDTWQESINQYSNDELRELGYSDDDISKIAKERDTPRKLITLTTKEALVAPSTEEAGRIFFDVMDENPQLKKMVSKDLVKKDIFPGPGGKEKEKAQKNDNKNLKAALNNKKKTDYEKAVLGLMETIQDPSYSEVKRVYSDALRKKGYNSLSDTNGSQYAKTSLIVLNGSKSLETTNVKTFKNKKEIREYAKDYYDGTLGEEVRHIMTNVEELHHHGIKNQRWGVRRTKEQLARARKKSGTSDDNNLTTAKAIKTKASSKRKKKLISEMSNDELDQVIERMKLEMKLKELSTKPKDSNKKDSNAFIQKSIGTIGDTLIKEVAAPAAVYIVANVVNSKFGKEVISPTKNKNKK